MQHEQLGLESVLNRLQPAVGPFSRRDGCWPCIAVPHILAGIDFILWIRDAVGRLGVRHFVCSCRSWRLLWASACDIGLGQLPRLLRDPLLLVDRQPAILRRLPQLLAGDSSSDESD